MVKTNKLVSFALLLACLTFILPMSVGCSGIVKSNRFLELMNMIPAAVASGDKPAYYTLTNYASFFQDYGITFTNFDDLTNQIKKNFTAFDLIVGGSDITGWGKYAEHTTIQEKYMGYDVSNIDAEIQFGQPPNNGVAAIGRFDPQAVNNALNNRDEWPAWAKDSYTTEVYRGVTVHSWGDGLAVHLEGRLKPPHIDTLGRAMPLAITDKYLFYAPSVDTIKLMIDASQDKGQSLADLKEYAAVANSLAGLKAYGAMVGDGTLANPSFSVNTTAPRLKKLLTFSSGPGKDEKGTYSAIVIYHENSKYAQENVSLLKQRVEKENSLSYSKPWNEIVTETDIKAEGNVLIARLYSTHLSLWQILVFNEDNLLLHEE
jgi:hypothetical protein